MSRNWKRGGRAVARALFRLTALAGVWAAAAVLLGVLPPVVQAQSRQVTLLLPEEPEIIDPCMSSRSTVGRVVKQNIAESLTEIDPSDGSVKPRLASSWKKVDALTWRFTLRPGIKYHDGTLLDAAAAAKSINRVLVPTLDCEVRTKFFGKAKVTPRAINATTLEIKSDIPLPMLPTNMGVVTLYKPRPEVDNKTYDRAPIGTGPYRFVRWTTGQEIILERFAGYWGKRPQVERARYIWRTESAVRAAMVLTGEADIVLTLNEQDANRPDLDFAYPNSETTRLKLDVAQPPLNDRRVRLAMTLAIDRAALKGSVFSKDVIPATQLIFPSINGHNPDLKVPPYDPARAKKLLAEARRDGVPVDKTIYLIGRIQIYPSATESLQAMEAMLNAVGFKTKLIMQDRSQWLKFNRKPFPLPRRPIALQNMHDNNFGDAAFTGFTNYHSKGANSTLNDPQLDVLIEKAMVATNPERRLLWQQAFKRINEDIIGDVILFHMVGFTRVAKHLNFKPSISTNSEIHIEDITFK